MSVAAARLRAATAIALAPDQVAGLALWLKADALALANNDPVSTWADSSGNALDATQGNPSLKPAFKTGVLNGLPVVRFDGTSDWMATAATGPVAQPSTLLVVVKHNSVATVQNIFDGIDFVSWQSLYLAAGALGWEVHAGVTGPQGGTPNTTPHVLTAEFNSAASTLHVDGTLIATANAGMGTFGGATLGSSAFGSGSFLNADVAEVVFYTRTLTYRERRAVEHHLGAKYQLAVA